MFSAPAALQVEAVHCLAKVAQKPLQRLIIMSLLMQLANTPDLIKNGLRPNGWAQHPIQGNWGMGGEGCMVTHHMM
jgi:hypothetical protein